MTRLGVPDSIKTVLSYADSFAISPGAQAGTYVFRGNSLYDPDYTSTGDQPYYYDELQRMYSRYRVFASKLTVSVMNNVGTSPVQITIVPSSEVFTLGLTTHPLEYPRAKPAKLLGVAGYNTTSVSQRISTREILGLKDKQVLDEDFSALTGANPASIWYWMISAYDIQAANVSVAVQVKLQYECELYDRVTVDPSLAVRDPEKIPREERISWARATSDPPIGPVVQVQVVDQPVLVQPVPIPLSK